MIEPLVTRSIRIAAALVAAGTLAVQARTLRVTTTANEFQQNSVCSVMEAAFTLNRWPTPTTDFGCGLADGNNDEIYIPQGTYTVTNDLVFDRTAVVRGDGIGKTTIVSHALHLFQVNATSQNPNLILEKMTFQGASGSLGNALFVNNGNFAPSMSNLAAAFLTDVRVHGFTLSALFNDGGHLFLDRCVIENNTGEVGAGITNFGFTPFGGFLSVYSSTISGNRAQFDGGGVYNLGWASFSATTISGNTAGEDGGGVFTGIKEYDFPGSPYLELSQATVTKNTAQRGGGAFSDPAAPGISGMMINSVVANNTAPTSPDFLGPTGSNQAPDFPNLVRSTSGATQLKGTDITGQDPRLGSLASNGGPTRTHLPLRGGPLVDRGGEMNESQDQRGFLRPIDGGTGRGAAYDIGAVEYDAVLQLERFSVANSSGDAHTLVYPNGDGANGWTRYASNANGDYVTYAVPIPENGTYDIKVRMVRHPDGGIYQVSTATSSGGTYSNLGSTKDCYASSPTTSETTIGSRSFSAGTRYIRFKVTSKNGSSSNRRLYFDGVRLTKL